MVQFSDLKNVIAYLRERHCLLLLDNAEDILWQDEDAMQDIIDSILKFTLNTTLLITSQRPVGGNLYEPERVYRLYPLKQNDAATLFYATTKRRMSQREYESHTFHTLLEQLGGHPLSLVLTARQLAPGVHLEDLLERIKVYKAKAIQIKNITDRDLEHGESLVASLASAHHVLSDKAQTLFEILSMLPAGAQQDKLTKIYGSTAWEYVQELNDASLAEIRDRRATLLPPVRLFALNICTDEIKRYYGPKIVEVMGAYAKELYGHHNEKDAKEYRFYFTADEPNLRSAVDLPCVPSQTDKEPSALRLLGPNLILLYTFHNRWKEAKEVGNSIITNLRKLRDHLGEADTLTTLGILSMRRGDLEGAQKRFEKALTIYQDTDEKMWEANTLWALGDLALKTGDYEGAQKRYKRALKIYQCINKKLGEANAFMRLGILAFRTGDHEGAQKRYKRALKIYQHINAKIGEANTFRALGDLAMWTGELEGAQRRYKRALKIYQITDAKDGVARTFIRLAQQAALTDELDHAETSLNNALTINREIEDLEGQADAHLVKAFVFLKHHNAVKAKRQLDCCSSIQDKIYAHCEAAQWLILYALHFNLHNCKEGTKLCLKYAELFASKAKNQHLLDHVKQLSGAV
ncbi:MAG: hypothetical protein AYK19_20420 [Theionarchaea archaeon DG-70-1]|nr:MAG: hypothetical protein AYK19_20420 [Theionarchaea archaeon DG-70-1]